MMILIHLADKKLTVVILSESDVHDRWTIGTADFSFDLNIEKLLVLLLTASLHACLQLHRFVTLNAYSSRTHPSTVRIYLEQYPSVTGSILL